MRYFVIGDDGQKYGPADIPTLQSWIGEGRLLPTQQVEEEGSGSRLAAGAVNGLNFPAQSATPGAQAPTGSPYASPYSAPVGVQMQSGDDGKNDLIVAWVLGGVGAFFCLCGLILQPIALIFANRAINKGNPGGNAVKIFNIVFLCISVVILLAYIFLIKTAMSNPGAFQPGQQPFAPK